MKRVKFIEMPREEIRLDELEKAMIGAGDNCHVYEICENNKRSICQIYNTEACSGGSCGGDTMYCPPFK